MPYLLTGTKARLFSSYDFNISYVNLSSKVQESYRAMNCNTRSILMRDIYSNMFFPFINTKRIHMSNGKLILVPYLYPIVVIA